MAWFRKEKKPRHPRGEKLEIPADAWEKCEACGHTDFREKFIRNLNVCPSCGYHRRIRASDYVNILLDDGSVEELEVELRSVDPLGFPDYPSRLKKAIAKAGDRTRSSPLAGRSAKCRSISASWISLSWAGPWARLSAKKSRGLDSGRWRANIRSIIVSASGGARMQEGMLSLMQMAKTSAVLSQLAERRIPYVSILTNPTMGGVSASFAMFGDAIIAEPGAVIGFAGPRVIKQTLGQDLPEGFQTAEFFLDHGMVDSWCIGAN